MDINLSTLLLEKTVCALLLVRSMLPVPLLGIKIRRVIEKEDWRSVIDLVTNAKQVCLPCKMLLGSFLITQSLGAVKILLVVPS
ncbi:hypothetical protein ACFX1R_005120 [Malus domestica]